MSRINLLAVFLCLAILKTTVAQDVVIDAAKRFQTIRTLGVNANPQSWSVNPHAVAAVVDKLIDSMGCTSFRLMFDDCDWETTNDNEDPNDYNWSFYDSIYKAPRFAQIWDMIRYLNKKGITDITLSPDGAGPKWLGGTKLTDNEEAEYAETIASMVMFARTRISPAIEFNSISPINETTCGGREGIMVTPAQIKTIYHDVAQHLINDNLKTVTIIGPDDCSGWLANAKALMEDSLLMTKLSFLGQHEYGNSTVKSAGLVHLADSLTGSRKEVLMTEANARCVNCDGGTYNADYGFDAYAGPAYRYLLQHLNAGVSGIQIWEAYDSRYHHPHRTLTWSMWGIFSVSDTLKPDVYAARPQFQVMKQLYLYVKPGDVRVSVDSVPGMVIAAFADAGSKRIVFTGINTTDRPKNIRGVLKGFKRIDRLSFITSDQREAFRRKGRIAVRKQKFLITIPAKSVFTLASR